MISYRQADILQRVKDNMPTDFVVTFEADQNFSDSLHDQTLITYRGVDEIKEWTPGQDSDEAYFIINERRTHLEDLVHQSFEYRAGLDEVHADRREAWKGIGFHLHRNVNRNEWVKQVKSEEHLVIDAINIVKNDLPDDERIVSMGDVVQLENNSAMYGFKVSVR